MVIMPSKPPIVVLEQIVYEENNENRNVSHHSRHPLPVPNEGWKNFPHPEILPRPRSNLPDASVHPAI